MSMYFGASKETILFARQLRLHMTQAEIILWEHIRNKQLGCKFRNQHPIYKYVVDFFCFELLLFIEVDGSIHTLTEVALNDKDREDNLLSLGLHVIRFTNDEILSNIDKVLIGISNMISELQLMKSSSGDLGANNARSSPLSGVLGANRGIIRTR